MINGYLKGGSMSINRANSGINIPYVDRSNSGIGASLYQSSADPLAASNEMQVLQFSIIYVQDEP